MLVAAWRQVTCTFPIVPQEADLGIGSREPSAERENVVSKYAGCDWNVHCLADKMAWRAQSWGA